MSPRDFDRDVGCYLDGEATRAQVVAIRRVLRERPELKSRLADLVRLHRAQSVVLVKPPRSFAPMVLGHLRAFADRSGRALTHVCLLLLVCLELDVALPMVESQSWVNGGRPVPVMVPVTEVLGTEFMEVLMGTETEPEPEVIPQGMDISDPMAPESAGALPSHSDPEQLLEG
jgi:hypothetical protein